MDIRKMDVISIESQKFVMEHLLPSMINYLKGKDPIVVQLMDKSDIFAKVTANKIKDKSKGQANGFEVMQFTDRPEMEAYLRSI